MIPNSRLKKKKKPLSKSSHFLEEAAESLASTHHLGHAAPKVWGVSWLEASSSQIQEEFLEPQMPVKWGMREAVMEGRTRKVNLDMPNLPRTQKATAAIWAHGKAFQKEPDPPGGEKPGYVCRRMCHVIAQLQAPSGTLPTSTVPRPENKPGVPGSECEKRMFWGVRETAIAFSPLWEKAEKMSSHPDILHRVWLQPPRACGWRSSGPRIFHQNSNKKWSQVLNSEVPVLTKSKWTRCKFSSKNVWLVVNWMCQHVSMGSIVQKRHSSEAALLYFVFKLFMVNLCAQNYKSKTEASQNPKGQ